MPFACVIRGVHALILRSLGFSPLRRDDEALERVDSIDIIVVGLGLILILLVLLRR